MKVLSLFSGVGGFDLGLEAAGMETVALCEWDRHAQSVLRRHWPNTPLYGDVSELTGAQLIADDGREQADSHRYKQIGNGVASPVALWVGRQIFAAEHLA